MPSSYYSALALTEPLLVSPRVSYVERVIGIQDIELFDLSKDGKTALGLSNRTGSYQLAAVDTRGGPLRPVSHGKERVAWARISNDSETVCFSRDFGGKEEHQLFTIALEDGEEEEQLTQLPPTRVFDFNWYNGDDRLTFAGATKEANGLWIVDSSNGTHAQIFQNRHWVFSPEWSRDDSRICVSAKTTEHPTAAELVFLFPEGGQEPLVYTPKPGSENTNGGWHPSQPTVLFKTDARGRYELALYKTETQELSYLKGGDLGLDFPVFSWMPDGGSVYYLAANKGRTRLYIEPVDTSEQPREVPLPDGYHAGFFGSSVKAARSGDYFVFSWSSLSTPPTLSRLNTATGRVETLHEHYTDLPLGRAEPVVYGSFDGRPIHGWFLRPARTEGRRPCVLWIHALRAEHPRQHRLRRRVPEPQHTRLRRRRPQGRRRSRQVSPNTARRRPFQDRARRRKLRRLHDIPRNHKTPRLLGRSRSNRRNHRLERNVRPVRRGLPQLHRTILRQTRRQPSALRGPLTHQLRR